MGTLMDKLKSNRTRPAEIQGESVQVKVYSGKEWEKLGKNMEKMNEEKTAEFLADQFLDDKGSPVMTAEFLLSAECPACVPLELSKVFMAVNMGNYSKN